MNTRACCLRLCLLLGVLFTSAGCQTVPDTGRYAVTSVKAPFYKYGPAQAFGADFALARGQHVTMVERGFGFSRVLTEDGVTGFVSTDDIAPSPEPPPVPQSRVASRRGAISAPRKKAAVLPEPDSGLFNVNDVPLPTDAEPAKKPAVQPPKPDPKPDAQAAPKPAP
jgi:hypothetical protein